MCPFRKLLSQSRRFLRFIHIGACSSISFLHCLIAFHCLYIPHFIYYPFFYWRTLGCFHFLHITHKTSINICVQGFVQTYVFISLGIDIGVEFLWHIVILYLFLKVLTGCFKKRLHHFTIPLAMHEISNFLFSQNFFI